MLHPRNFHPQRVSLNLLVEGGVLGHAMLVTGAPLQQPDELNSSEALHGSSSLQLGDHNQPNVEGLHGVLELQHDDFVQEMVCQAKPLTSSRIQAPKEVTAHRRCYYRCVITCINSSWSSRSAHAPGR